MAIAQRVDGEASDPLFFSFFGSWCKPKRHMEWRWPRRGRCDIVFFYGESDWVEADAAQDICKALARSQAQPSTENGVRRSLRRHNCAEFFTVPNSGHGLQVDNPEFIATEILQRIPELTVKAGRSPAAVQDADDDADSSPSSAGTSRRRRPRRTFAEFQFVPNLHGAASGSSLGRVRSSSVAVSSPGDEYAGGTKTTAVQSHSRLSLPVSFKESPTMATDIMDRTLHRPLNEVTAKGPQQLQHYSEIHHGYSSTTAAATITPTVTDPLNELQDQSSMASQASFANFHNSIATTTLKKEELLDRCNKIVNSTQATMHRDI
eukprot:gnl/MRDRNA2_/MRDRNA2_291132_c0_seq1.p1 gnl/MRDRNA2_/MRDRNA2_291132_c0~~gnl/MRDRNA2_/MRDRNA2_291132_c0_seq1.p1  ORF type:complete len:360 (-),score=50.46 gnl/MRDRNA2_/MRDRNA2_291132_c0_seq1:250-1209(-)